MTAARSTRRNPPYGADAVELIYAPQHLDEGVEALSGQPVFRAILDRAGTPRFRRRRNGFATLLHIILEQNFQMVGFAHLFAQPFYRCYEPQLLQYGRI